MRKKSFQAQVPAQLLLFNPDTFDDGALYAAMQQMKLAATARTPNTRKVYAWTWGQFVAWCEERNRCPLPASEDTLALFVAHMFEEKQAKVTTVNLYLTAIRHVHVHNKPKYPSPVTAEVRDLIRGAKARNHECGVSEGKKALTADELKQICTRLVFEESLKDKPRYTDGPVRNRALILLGFAGGMRRSEIVGLDLADVKFDKRGLEVTIKKSKNQPEPRVKPVFRGRWRLTCPVRALEDWLAIRGKKPGPLFTHVKAACRGIVFERLWGNTVNDIVKGAVESIGLDPAAYGAHSLRAGLVTTGHLNGASDTAIMRITGHTTTAMVRRYQRNADVLASVNPLRGKL